MEPAEIAVVLARASDLHAKINDAILRTSAREQTDEQKTDADGDRFSDDEARQRVEAAANHRFQNVQKLRAIRDALLSLEDNLDSLQALQKQQKAERDEILIDLEESRKILIGKLQEYNGMEWEIIQEAHAFAGEPVKKKDDLVLPPYQSHVPDIGRTGHSGISRKRSLSTSGDKLSSRSSLTNRPEEEGECKDLRQFEAVQQDVENVSLDSNKPSGFGRGISYLLTGIGRAVGVTAKTALVIASVIAILTFSRLEPGLRKRSAERVSKLQYLGNRPNYQGNNSTSPSSRSFPQDEFCPPGKVLVVQDGVKKCFVKERVEAPFKEVKQPDASYGYG